MTFSLAVQATMVIVTIVAFLLICGYCFTLVPAFVGIIIFIWIVLKIKEKIYARYKRE